MLREEAITGWLKSLTVEAERKYYGEVYMQAPDEQSSHPTVLRPKKLIKHPHHFLATATWRQHMLSDTILVEGEEADAVQPPTVRTAVVMPASPDWNVPTSSDPDAAIPEELLDVSSMSTLRLIELSSRMRAVRVAAPKSDTVASPASSIAAEGVRSPGELQGMVAVPDRGPEDTMNSVPYPPANISAAAAGKQESEAVKQPQPEWRAALHAPAVRTVLGLVIGLGVLFLVFRFVNLQKTLDIVRQHLMTPEGIGYALLAATSFIASFSIRGTRWRLFLSRICTISTLKAIQIFWVAVFLNFLLPVQGGEVAKSLMLKQIKRVPISQSLPTVAMDKSLDLLPALIIMAAVPFIPGIHMSITLWLILAFVGSILIGLIGTVALMAWNRAKTTWLIHTVLKLVPRGIGGKIEGFALGFIDSLLAGASNPKTFIPAVLLTCLAVTCDGLFAWFAFLAVGAKQMGFGTAIFGYTTYNMFSILPAPPGQAGTNELWGQVVFAALLGFPRTGVAAMYILSHPMAALIMTSLCLISLRGLGISIASAMRPKVRKDGPRGDKRRGRSKGMGDTGRWSRTTDHLAGIAKLR